MKVKSTKKLGTNNRRLNRIKFWLGRRSLIQKINIVIALIVFISVSTMYGVAQWYISSQKDKPLTVGATFIPDYARYYGLDAEETMRAMIDDLDIKNFRLVSYWSKGEPVEGVYDFSELDWQFALAEATNSKVSLAIGLRQPRWPECHMPTWAENSSMIEWEPKLKRYMKATMERYKDSPSLVSYQLENEFFLDVFGICPDHSRDRLIREYEYVKNIDSNHPVIITRSNNALGLPIGDPQPDKFGVSIYKRVWDKTITKRYIEYPFPAWFYSSLAGGGKILVGKDLFIHELQTEAWLPDSGQFMMNDIGSIPEQEKSLNAERLRERIRYGEATGMKQMDLWGVEWWYWQKTKAGKSDLWETAKSEIKRIESENLLKTN